MADARESSSAFWPFSVALYGRAEVSDACLWLQDHCGLDVNFLLFALHCGCRGTRVGAADWLHLDRQLRPWRTNVVSPLRAVRRWLKSDCDYASVDASAVRGRVLAVEIECEQLQQRIMEAIFAMPEGIRDENIAADNLKGYLQAASVAASEGAIDRLCTLLCCTFPSLSRRDARALLT